jgi:hypothetical protein
MDRLASMQAFVQVVDSGRFAAAAKPRFSGEAADKRSNLRQLRANQSDCTQSAAFGRASCFRMIDAWWRQTSDQKLVDLFEWQKSR